MTPCPRCATPLDRLPTRCPVCGGSDRPTPAARRVVAAYLAGEAADVRTAWAAARDDAAFTDHLTAELGLDLEASPCAVFRDQAAAFADLPPAARDAEAADLADHARDCPACRRLLWELRPLWDAAGELAEPLRVDVSATGVVRDRGLGPPAAPVEFAALRAGPDEASPPPLEWRLDAIRLRVSAGPRVAVWVEAGGGTVEFAANGLSTFSGSLDDLPPDGLPLPAGRWDVTVTLADGPRRFALDLTTEGA